MKKIFLALLSIGSFSVFAQEKLFTAADFTPEKEFTINCEGPSVDAKGNVFAVNIHEDGTIAKISKEGKTSVFLTLPKGSIGNGIRFDSKNTFYVADFKNHNVLKVDILTKKVSTYSTAAMNQPNDLAIMQSGLIFCSDPNWAAGTGRIWRVANNGKAEVVADSMGTTNGIEVSADEKTLYVNESVQHNVWAFDIQKGGHLANKHLLIKFEDGGGMDGMRCDIKGNLYIARWGKGEVMVISPKGAILRTIQLKGLKSSNICFGGPDGKTCYVTLQDRGCLETFRTDTPGREWKMMQQFH